MVKVWSDTVLGETIWLEKTGEEEVEARVQGGWQSGWL